MENYRRRSLVVTEGPDQGATYSLEGSLVTLGRATDNTVVLDSGKVSRHHAQIRLSPSGAIIEDLGSTNGTWVNSERIVEPRALAPGDIIRLADYVAFRYIAPQPQEGTARIPQSWNQAPTQISGQGGEAAGSRTRTYEEPGYAQPYVPQAPRAAPSAPPQMPPVRPTYSPPPSAHPSMAYAQPQEPVESEQAPERTRPRWLYVLIGLLAILLCLCVAVAVYIWFAPPSFWEWLFDLFNIPLPEGYPNTLGYLCWMG